MTFRNSRTIKITAAAVVSLLICFTGVAQENLYINTFPSGDVTLLEGFFQHARDLNIRVLLEYDTDRLIAPSARRRVFLQRPPCTPTGKASTVMSAAITFRPWQ